MQAKRHMTKLIKYIPSSSRGKLQKAVKLDRITVTKI